MNTSTNRDTVVKGIRKYVPPAIFGVIAVLFCWPAIKDLRATGFGDWQYFHHLWESARVSVQRYGALPLWNPFQCGGVTLWGDPEAPIASPFFWMSLLTGTVTAMKLQMVVHCFMGMLGMYCLGKDAYQLSMRAAAFAAVAWSCSGIFASDFAGGHVTFVTLTLLPWISWSWRRSLSQARWMALLAALFVWILWLAGTYVFFFAALLLVFEIALSFRALSVARLLTRLGALVAFSAAAGAIRWVPVYLTLRRYPRSLKEVWDQLSYNELMVTLSTPQHSWRFAGHEYVWHEYDAYVGWFVIAFGIFGIAQVILQRRYLGLIVGLLIFTLLACGHFASFAPWPLLQKLPYFSMLRVPSRLLCLVVMYLSLLAGVGLDGLTRFARMRLPQRLVDVIVYAAISTALVIEIEPNLAKADLWHGSPLVLSSSPKPFFLRHASKDFASDFVNLPERGEGIVQCWAAHEIPWPRSQKLWIGRNQQARLYEGVGSIEDVQVVPSQIDATVALRSSAVIVFNQSYHPDWRTNRGFVRENANRLAVVAPTGRYRLLLRYSPPEFVWVCLSTCMGLILLIVYFFRCSVFADAGRLFVTLFKRPKRIRTGDS